MAATVFLYFYTKCNNSAADLDTFMTSSMNVASNNRK